MDILYIVKGGAGCYDDFELRCSLRSIARYGHGIGRVFMVGGCPRWLSGEVVRIPYKDEQAVDAAGKNRNILAAAVYAVEHSDIGAEFLVSMDDHFYAQEVDFDNYPYYCKTAYTEDGELPRTPGDNPASYRAFLYASRQFLEAHGLPTKCLTLHRNMHCARAWLDGASGLVREVLEGGGVCEPWVLLNNWALAQGLITPTLVADKKINNRMAWGRASYDEVFSTGDFRAGTWMQEKLRSLYPDKCKYER